MLEAIIDFFPVILLFYGSFISLAVNTRKLGGKIVTVAIPMTAGGIVLARALLLGAPANGNGNLIENPATTFTFLACLVLATLILINGTNDLPGENASRFYNVLGFLAIGGICGFVQANNMLLIALFPLIAQIFLAILKFIYPAPEKRAFNTLIAISVVGVMLFAVGVLILNEGIGGSVIALTKIDPASIPPVAVPFLFAGMLLICSVFPASLITFKDLHDNSHVAVKAFSMLLTAVGWWKYMYIFDKLGLTGGIFTWIHFILGMGNICAGIGVFLKEFVKNGEKHLDMLVMALLLVDFGIILSEYAMLGELISNGGAATIITAMRSTIVLQVLIIMVMKITLLVSVKNVEVLFKNRSIDKMGGLRLSQPITLVGFATGAFGSIFPGILVLDGIYRILIQAPTSIINTTTFWTVFLMMLFSATWIALVGARIFGGKELPVSVRSREPPKLALENLTVIVLIVIAGVFIALLIFLPPGLLEGLMISS